MLALVLVTGCAASSRATDPSYAVVMETQPTPMQSGRLATVTIRIKDAGGQPLSGANVTFKGQHSSMAHGAGASVATQEREPGVYSGGFTPTMGGKYTMTVTLEGSQGKSEKTLDAEVQ
jgi:hypothetical protein